MPPKAPPVAGSSWLNCRPIPWTDLGGQVVLVVFWSFGCEASLLRIRQIEAIVEATAHPVSAIAIHTPRFPFEESVDAVESAIAQHAITIPVLHDPEYRNWTAYNPGGWPATIVVDGRGRVLGAHEGVGDLQLLIDSVAAGVRPISSHSAPTGQTHQPSASRTPATPLGPLAFPTSVAPLPDGRFVVADSGNDRLLMFQPDAGATGATAVGEIGGFVRPHGVIADGSNGLYVTEPALGAVSHLDLVDKTRRLVTDDLTAPTSLTVDNDGSLVVTDGAADTIFRIVDDGVGSLAMGVIAGSGVTGSRDGVAGQAELAQPMGVARTEAGLVFCDAASSNVRLLTDSGKVATVTGNGFYEWGLVDGSAHEAKLQRPSDLIVADDGSIVIVDTGNNRLRQLASRRIRTLGLAGLNRPAGIARLVTGHLVVADTGNSRLVIVDPDLRRAWPMTLHGVLPRYSAVPKRRYRRLGTAEAHSAA